MMNEYFAAQIEQLRKTDIEIARLDLSARAYNTLRINGIKTLSEFAGMNIEQLKKLDYATQPIAEELYLCSRECLNELRRRIHTAPEEKREQPLKSEPNLTQPEENVESNSGIVSAIQAEEEVPVRSEQADDDAVQAPTTQDQKLLKNNSEDSGPSEASDEIMEPESRPESGGRLNNDQTDTMAEETEGEKSESRPIEVLKLSVRSYNCLKRARVNTVEELMALSLEDLANIKNMGRKSVEEIASVLSTLPEDSLAERDGFTPITREVDGATCDNRPIEALGLSIGTTNYLKASRIRTIQSLLDIPPEELVKVKYLTKSAQYEIVTALNEYREAQAARLTPQFSTEAVVTDNRPIEELNLSVRAYNCLKGAKIDTVQQLMDISVVDLIKIRNLGKKSLEEIEAFRNSYVPRTVAHKKIEYSAEELKPFILELYAVPFKGLSFDDFRAKLPSEANDETIKQAVGNLLAEGKLEYVDFRCYRVYPSYHEYFDSCLDELDERSREVLVRRFSGDTLESIAKNVGITRERVRQIYKREKTRFIRKIRKACKNNTGKSVFDEDFYKPLFTKCDIPASFWLEELNLSQQTLDFLTITFEKGNNKPEDVLGDDDIPVSLRYRLRSYLDRDKLRVDGKLFPRNRTTLEEYALKKYAQDELLFNQFVEFYNGMLEANEIPFDEKLYYTDANIRTRTNRFGDSLTCLWKQGERLRYYDIASRDYTELIETLHLDSYHNTEVSTLKFVELYPELMEKYDIRDQHELHNLLKKISKDYGLEFITFSRQPILQFGDFDRLKAIKEAMVSLSPVTQTDLIDYLHQEYGYDKATAVGYLTPLGAFYHNGVYSVDFKRIPDWRIEPLMGELTGEFYFIDEIRKLYTTMFRDADPDEINPYTLKAVGFNVYSNYAIQGQISAYNYFKRLLTKEEVYDIQGHIKRYGSIRMFNQTYNELKAKHLIFAFEKDQIITLSRLQKLGVTEEDIDSYCAAVRDFEEDGAYFTVCSLQNDGFSHSLENLGFDDYFYASLLSADTSFSWQRMFGEIVLYNGVIRGMLSTDSFLRTLLREYDSVDVDEFIQDCADHYHVMIPSHYEVTNAIKETEMYYDPIMDKIYRDKTIYYAEFDD